MYTLYIGNKNYSSWSLRPWVLMTGLEIPFDEKLVPFHEGSNRDRFRKFSPAGQVPCLHDGETVVWDSLAIVEYLAERHPPVWPADRLARAWSRCATAEMHAGFSVLRNQCPMNCGLRVRLHGRSDDLQQNLVRLNELWCDGLSRFGGPFLGGATFTAVDAFYAPVAYRMQTYELSLGELADDYAGRLRELPAMRTWYAAGLAETWREKGHDAEAASVGTVVQDLRAAV